MPKAATIRDVARAAGVSTAAVSRVMNAGSGPVSPTTREKVLKAIEELSYRPSAVARELKHNPRTTLGLVLADVTNPFFAQLADRVVWEARGRGVNVLLMTTREDPHLEQECLTTLLQRRVGGVIATPTSDNLGTWAELEGQGASVVFVDRSVSGVGAGTVSIADEESARAATEHLLELGHRRIGFVSGPRSTTTGHERINGHLAALAEHGIGHDPALVHSVPFRGDRGADAVGALLDLPAPPTALVVANTAQVVSALRRLVLRGVRLPADLSVVVFDDNPWTELFSPALTVVRQPVAMLARHSVSLALSEDGLERRTVRVAADLVVRSSTAAPPAGQPG